MVRNEKPNWTSIGVNAFGSALGDAVVGSIQQADSKRLTDAQIDKYLEGVSGSGNPEYVSRPLSNNEIADILSDIPGNDEMGSAGGRAFNAYKKSNGLSSEEYGRQSYERAKAKVFAAEDAQAEAEHLAMTKLQNAKADAYRKELAAQRETAAARALLDGYVGGGSVSADSFAAGAAGGRSILGTPMPMKLGNGGQWVASPDHPNYIVPPVAYQGQDSNFLGFVKGGVSSISADAVVWGGRNGGALGTGAAFLGYTGLVAGELLPGSTTELALGAVAGPVIGKGLGLVTEAAVSRFPVLGKSVSELWSGSAAANSGRTAATEFAGGTQTFASDLSHVTGKAADARNRAIGAVIKEDFPNLNLTYTPEYSPFINQGVAQEGAGTQIGKNMFSSRADLRDTIIHEELHHRWWERGIYDHHPLGSDKEARFYETIERYNRMRGWSD
ncbi:MAG: hypothetical protein QM742_10020 [Aquabacterium sp.]